MPEWPKRCTLKKTIDAVHHLVTLVNTLYLRRSISPDFTKLISLQEFILELFGVIGALAKGSELCGLELNGFGCGRIGVRLLDFFLINLCGDSE